MKSKRRNKNGQKYNINKDFRGGERCLYRSHDASQQDGDSDVSSDMGVSLHKLSIEVKYLYIARKVIYKKSVFDDWESKIIHGTL